MNHILNLKSLRLLTLALGCFALMPGAQAVSPPPDGDYPGGNTAEGFNALFDLSTQDGGFNTAVGFYSLFSNTTGSFNTGVGAGALDLNTGQNNTATGAAALLLNTTGSNNTAVGTAALLSNNGALAEGNTAVGAAALFNNTVGSGDTAVGAAALFNNTDGNLNTALGVNALASNTEGGSNTAVGGGDNEIVSAALGHNTTGSGNTAIGRSALGVNTTGSFNIALGNSAGESLTTGNFNIDIGNDGVADEANTIRIGTPFNPSPTPASGQNKAFVAGIRGIATGNNDAIPVVIDSAGQLGTMSSSRRFKTEITPMDEASEAILALRPVTFRYKTNVKGKPQFGLIAEDVAQVNPDLVVRDKDGQIYTVRYDAVNAMLLNEFLKEHKTVQEQGATIARLQKQVAALTAGLQKVSAQLELSKSAPQTVLNDP